MRRRILRSSSMAPMYAHWWKKATKAGVVVRSALSQYGVNWTDNVSAKGKHSKMLTALALLKARAMLNGQSPSSSASSSSSNMQNIQNILGGDSSSSSSNARSSMNPMTTGNGGGPNSSSSSRGGGGGILSFKGGSKKPFVG